jgi:hypothetical protein
MAITNPQIRLKLLDLTAKTDSVPTSTDIQSFVDIDDIKNSFTPTKYATLEDGQWEFNKEFKILPDDLTSVQWGYWSYSMSNSIGAFTTPVELIVSFDSPHTSNGITIDFWSASEDWCDDIDIYWYDSVNVLIDSANFSPDATTYFCNNLVEDYYKVKIIFNATNKPYRYVKIQNIDYGEIVLFDKTLIVSSTLLEEVDLTTDSISVNSLDFTVQLPSSARTEEILTVLQETQEIEVIELVNNVPVQMGTFYVSLKEKKEEKILRIEGEDLIGKLETSEHLGGLYNSVTVQSLVDEIMLQFGTTLYEVDTSIASLTLTGHLPIQSCKDSLQDVAFSVNAVVDCSRDNKIKIYRLDSSSVISLVRNDLFNYTETDVKKQIKPVTGIILNLKSYLEVATVVELYKKNLAIGNHTIKFSNPSSNLSITGGTITSSNANYAIVNVAVAGEVVISGYEFAENITSLQKENTLSSSIKPNIIVFENTLTWDITQNAEYLRDYETQSHEVTFDKVATDVIVGDYISLEGYGSKTFTGYIVSNDVDLSNGFRGNVRAIGVIS